MQLCIATCDLFTEKGGMMSTVDTCVMVDTCDKSLLICLWRENHLIVRKRYSGG